MTGSQRKQLILSANQKTISSDYQTRDLVLRELPKGVIDFLRSTGTDYGDLQTKRACSCLQIIHLARSIWVCRVHQHCDRRLVRSSSCSSSRFFGPSRLNSNAMPVTL